MAETAPAPRSALVAEVRRQVDLPVAPDEAWELVVDDDERAGWFGGDTTMDPVPGGDADFTDPDGGRRLGRVDEAEPGRRIAWTWWPEGDRPDGERTSRVEVDLDPHPDGTRVTIVERPLVPMAALRASSLLELEHRALLRAATVVRA